MPKKLTLPPKETRELFTAMNDAAHAIVEGLGPDGKLDLEDVPNILGNLTAKIESITAGISGATDVPEEIRQASLREATALTRHLADLIDTWAPEEPV